MPILINENVVQVEVDPTRVRTTVSFDVQGADTAELRLTELDQSDPEGRYRFRVVDKALQVERATAANWGDFAVMISISQDGVTLDLPSDEVFEALQALYLETSRLREVVELVLA
jgi:hypothetical protein